MSKSTVSAQKEYNEKIDNQWQDYLDKVDIAEDFIDFMKSYLKSRPPYEHVGETIDVVDELICDDVMKFIVKRSK